MARQQGAKADQRAGVLMLLFLLSGLMTSQHAVAQSPAEFYKAKTIRLLIGFGPGGGYDLYARLLARHMDRHIPGNPSIVPENMPGAGSLLVVNHLAHASPRDGTVFATFASGVPAAPLLTPEQVKFKSTDLTWIGSANDDVLLDYISHTAPATTIDGVRQREIILGSTGPGAAAYDFPVMAKAILGFKYKLVTGYKGSNDINLAIERGEVHGAGGLGWRGLKTSMGDALREKKVIVLAQYGRSRLPELPDVPLVMDLVTNDADRQALQLVLSRQELGRPFAAPPLIPADRTAALRKAFDAAMVDPALLADAAKQQLDIMPVDGATVAASVAALANTPREVVDRVQKILAPQ